MKNTKKNISIEKLHPFENHPYKVQDNEEMERLAESIKQNGVVSPIIVRPLENTTLAYISWAIGAIGLAFAATGLVHKEK